MSKVGEQKLSLMDRAFHDGQQRQTKAESRSIFSLILSLSKDAFGRLPR
jgi:hypothetical protein